MKSSSKEISDFLDAYTAMADMIDLLNHLTADEIQALIKIAKATERLRANGHI